MLKRLVTVTAAVMMVGALAIPALAQTPKKRVLLVPLERGPNVSSVVPGRVFEAFKGILANNRTVQLTSLKTLKKAPPKAPRVAKKIDKLLQKADKALWAGKDLMRKQKYRAAVKLFKRAMKYYEKRFAELEDFDKYVDAALGVSLAFYYAGLADNGEDALAPVLILRPTTVLQKGRVPKEAIEALKRLRDIYSKTLAARLHIKSSPQGATVYVDGIRRGEAPVFVSDLWRGQHVVRVVKPGFQPASRRVTVGSRKLTLQLTLKPVKKAVVKKTKVAQVAAGNEDQLALQTVAKTGAFNGAFHKRAKRIVNQYRLDAIVLCYIRRAHRKYQMAVFVYDKNSGHVAALDWVAFSTDLADAQPKLLLAEERILQALAVFPRSKILSKRKKSKIYQIFVVKRPKPPKPKVVAKPRPVPKPRVRVVRKPRPRVRVRRPRVRPRVVVRPARPAPVPVVRRRPVRRAPVVRPVPVPVIRPVPARRVPVVRPVPVQPAPVVRPVPPPGRRVVRPVPVPVAPIPVPVVRPIPVRPVPMAPSPIPGGVIVPAPAPMGGGGGTGPVRVVPPPVVAPRIPSIPIVRPPVPLGGGVVPAPVLGTPPGTAPTPPPLSSLHLLRPGGMVSSKGPIWYKTWWFWTIVGAVVVGGTTAALAATLGGGSPAGFRTTVTWGP